MTYLLIHFLTFIALFLLFYLSGCAVASRVPALAGLGEDRDLVPMILGLALWIVLLFVAASVGLLRPVAIYVLAGALALVGLPAALRRSRRKEAPQSEVPQAVTPSRWGAAASRARDFSLDANQVFLLVSAGILVLGLLVVGLVLLLQAMGPNVSWDANVYHLTVPRLWIESHGFRPVPFNVYSNWPLNTELLFALGMILHDYVLAKLVHFGFGLLTLLLIYRMASRPGGSWVGLVGMALFLINDVVLYEIRVAYVDIAYAFFFLAGFTFLCRALDGTPGGDRRELLLCGLCCGVLAGIKLTGIFGLICLVALYLLGKRTTRGLSLLLVPSLVLLTPWLLKSVLFTGNPVYPFLYSLFGGPYWNAELGELHSAWQRAIGMGRGWSDYLLLPFRVILQGDYGYANFDGRIHPLWILLLPLAIWFGRKDVLVRRALLVSVLYFALWSLSSQQMRLLIPILPLLAIAAARALPAVLSRLAAFLTDKTGLTWPEVVQPAVSLLLAVLLLHSSLVYLVQTNRFLPIVRRYGEEVKDIAVGPTFSYVNHNLPPDAKIMFLNTNHGFFCRREYIADSFFEASQMLALLKELGTEEEILARFQELGLTHILVENRDRRIRYPKSFVGFLKNRNRVKLVYRSDDKRFSLLEIVRGSSG